MKRWLPLAFAILLPFANAALAATTVKVWVGCPNDMYDVALRQPDGTYSYIDFNWDSRPKQLIQWASLNKCSDLLEDDSVWSASPIEFSVPEGDTYDQGILELVAKSYSGFRLAMPVVRPVGNGYPMENKDGSTSVIIDLNGLPEGVTDTILVKLDYEMPKPLYIGLDTSLQLSIEQKMMTEYGSTMPISFTSPPPTDLQTWASTNDYTYLLDGAQWTDPPIACYPYDSITLQVKSPDGMMPPMPDCRGCTCNEAMPTSDPYTYETVYIYSISIDDPYSDCYVVKFSDTLPDPPPTPTSYTVEFWTGVYGTITDLGLQSQSVTPGCDAILPTVETEPGWKFAYWDPCPVNVHENIGATAYYTPVVDIWIGRNGLYRIDKEESWGYTSWFEWTQATSHLGVSSFLYNCSEIVPDAMWNAEWEMTRRQLGPGETIRFRVSAEQSIYLETIDHIGCCTVDSSDNGDGTFTVSVTAPYELDGIYNRQDCICITASSGYHITFEPGLHGSLANPSYAQQCVLRGEEVIDPGIIADEGWVGRWDKEFSPAYSDMIVTAIYTQKLYHVVFNPGLLGQIENQSLTEQDVPYGESAVDPGIIIMNPCWRFLYWDKALTEVRGDTTFEARYDLCANRIVFDAGDYGHFEDGSRYYEVVVPFGNRVEKPVVYPDEGWVVRPWDFDEGSFRFDYEHEEVTLIAYYDPCVYHTVIANGQVEQVPEGVSKTWKGPAATETGGVQVVCVGWGGTGSFKCGGEGDSVTTMISEDSELIWRLATNYCLSVKCDGPGSVRRSLPGLSGVAAPEEEWLRAGTEVTLKAVPDDDASFDRWTTTGLDEPFEGAEVTFALNGPVALIGSFHPNHVVVTFDPYPHGSLANPELTSQLVDYGGAAVDPGVVAEDGWLFTGWDSPFDVVCSNMTVRAKKYDCAYRITVDGVPVELDSLTNVKFEAQGVRESKGMQVRCIGWVGTGSFPPCGASNSITVAAFTNDSSLVWRYETNCWLQVGADGPGTVRDAATGATIGSCWLPQGTNIVVEAVPDEGAHFVLWEADGPMTNVGTRVFCSLAAPLSIKALFGRPCLVQPSIDLSALGEPTEDDVISLVGKIESGQSVDYLWRVVQVSSDGSYGIAANVGSSRECTVSLGAGTWRLEFYACDINGTWSEPVVVTKTVLPGVALPDLQLKADGVVFCDVKGAEVKSALTGELVMVSVQLANGPRAAMSGYIDVCLCEGWLTADDLQSLSDSRIVAKATLQGLPADARSTIELPWTVGRTISGAPAKYASGLCPYTVVVVSRTGAEEVRLGNNLASRLFPIGTGNIVSPMQMTLTGDSIWRKDRSHSISGQCWYDVEGSQNPAMGCKVKLQIDGRPYGSGSYTTSPEGFFGIMVAAPSLGRHTLTVSVTDGTVTCSQDLPFEVVDAFVVPMPNLSIASFALSGEGIYQHRLEYDIAHIGGKVQARSQVVNNGRFAVTNAFSVVMDVCVDGGDDWITVAAKRVTDNLSVGAVIDLAGELPASMLAERNNLIVRVRADPDDEVAESCEDYVDNERRQLLTVRRGPDLVPHFSLVAPFNVVIGETVSVDWTVANIGFESADKSFYVELVLDGSIVDRVLVEEPIGVGAAVQRHSEFVTSQFSSGRKYLSVRVDTTDAIDELCEDNNDATTQLRFYEALPDLSVHAHDISWTPSGTPRHGTEVTFSAKIANGQNALAAENVIVSFAVTGDGEYQSLGEVTVEKLQRGQQLVVESPAAYRALRGFHVVRVSLRTQAMGDRNETDNEATTSFDVEVPTALVDRSVFTQVVAGDAVSLVGTNSHDCSQYLWQVTDAPAESSGALGNPDGPIATFTPDVVGTYEVGFCVSDGNLTSEWKTVTIDVDRVAVMASGKNGDVSPSGRTVYRAGETPTYTFEPWEWYAFDGTKVDGLNVAAETATYTFKALTRSHALEMRAVCAYPFEVVDNGDDTYVIVPTGDVANVIVTIPTNVSPEKVTAMVSLDGPETVKAPKGVKLAFFRDVGTNRCEITKYLTCEPKENDGESVWNVDSAELNTTEKEKLAKAILSFTVPEGGTEEDAAKFNPAELKPIKTARTVPGLTYTLYESERIEGLLNAENRGASTVGDGKCWEPAVSTQKTNCRFYTIDVTK